MSERRQWREDSPDYAFDPATGRQRERWRRAMAAVTALRPLLSLLATACMLILAISSMGQVMEQLGGLLGAGYLEPEPPDPGLWESLTSSGVVRAFAVVVGFIVLRAVVAGVRAALGEPPGSICLSGENARVATVREARSAALAARSALDRLHSNDIRRRLEPHVEALDAITWTIATVMGADSPGLELELVQRCQLVKEAAGELEELVRAEGTLESLIPAVPPIPAPDAATLLEANDVILQAAHDEVRGLLRGIEALTGPSTLMADTDRSVADRKEVGS